MKSREEKFEEEVQYAKRALSRVDAESETIGTSSFARMANKSKQHFKASDVNQDDPVEIWGSRIGRWLGVGFAFALLFYLVITYL